MIPASVRAALREQLARGGSVAPGLPGAPFVPAPTPSVPTPGLANPRSLIGAHRRQRFAAGGAALPPHVLAALAMRPGYDDGGAVEQNALSGDPTDYTSQAPLPGTAETLASLGSGHAHDDLDAYARGQMAGLSPMGRAGAVAAYLPASVLTRGVDGAVDALTYPRNVMQGRVDPTSDEGIARNINLVGNAVGAGMPMAESGAAGVAGGRLNFLDAGQLERRLTAAAVPSEGQSIHSVHIYPADNMWEGQEGFYLPRTGDQPGGFKLERAADFMKSLPDGQDFHAPQLGIGPDGIGFDDGRHRFAAMRDLGLETAPVSMDPQSAAAAREMGLIAEDGPRQPYDASRLEGPSPEDMMADLLGLPWGWKLPDKFAANNAAIRAYQDAGSPAFPPTAPRPPTSRTLDPGANKFDVFHGTAAYKDFERFDPTLQGENISPHQQGAVFFTPDPQEAGAYARNGMQEDWDLPHNAGPRVLPATVDPGRTGLYNLTQMFDAQDPRLMQGMRDIAKSSGQDRYFDSTVQRELADRSARAAAGKPDQGLGIYFNAHNAAIGMAKQDGLDTAILRGLKESDGSDQLAVLTPNRVRSAIDGSLLYSSGLPIPSAAPTVPNDARDGFAHGGAASLPAHVRAALTLRPHYDLGGGVGGFGASDGHDNYGGSTSSAGTSSGTSSGTSTGSAGGVGGFGGSAGNDNYGGGAGKNDTGAATSAGTSTGGVGGSVGTGGHSDASTSAGYSSVGGGYGGGSNPGTSNGGGGGFSPGAASGQDSQAYGGHSDASTSNGYGGGYSATSGAVGSIGGSAGAPAAGGFSNDSAPQTGGFSSSVASHEAASNLNGFSGGSFSASSLDGHTAGQQASAQNGYGAPGEDGTTSAGAPGGLSTGQAFASFGPGASSPYGSLSNAQQTFGGVTSANLGNVPGLSPSGQQLGALGFGGVGAYGAMQGVGPAGSVNGLGAYGLSGEQTPGFDNFTAAGGLQQSMLGSSGFLGNEGNVAGTGYATPGGVMDGAMINALQGGLPGAEQVAQEHPGLPDYDKAFSPNYAGFQLGSDGTPMSFRDGNLTDYGAGAPSANHTSDTSGLNADGDPVAVGGISALTVHGNLSEAAQGVYDAPGTLSPFGQITDKQVADARQNAVKNGFASPQDSAVIAGYLSQQNSQAPGRTVGLGSLPASVATAVAATTGQVAGPGPTPSANVPSRAEYDAAEARTDALGKDHPMTQAEHDQLAIDGRTIAAFEAARFGVTPAPAQVTPAPQSLTITSGVPGVPPDAYSIGMHHIEGGVLNGQVDPKNPSHYGPAQFDQPTWSGVRAANPGLNLPGNMYAATAQQYQDATTALTNMNRAGLMKAGIDPTPENTYMSHLLGLSGAARAISAGPDATLAQAGISPRVQAANPSIFGGMTTVGQVQANIASRLERGAASASSAPPAAIAAASIPTGMYGNFSPGAASGLDTTDTMAPAAGLGITAPSSWSGPAAEPAAQSVSLPAPYGVSQETAAAIGPYGLAPTPANALAADTFGIANAAQIMNGSPADDISAVDISPDKVAANPGIFSGAHTLGDLQANIAKVAETAGTITSAVTAPPAAATGLGALPGYSFSPGVASGLDTVDPVAVSFGISSPDTYAGLGTAGRTPPGAASGAALGQPGPSPGAQGTPTSGAAPSTAPSAPAADTSSPSLPTGVTNAAANLGLGLFGGPIGGGIAAVNGISGLLGGPTIADGINGILAGGQGGAPSELGGQGGNSSGDYRYGSTMPSYAGPSVGGGGAEGDGSAASAGVNPLDPHATAMAAYQAALARMKGGTTSSGGAYDGTARPLTIHPGYRRPVTAASLYRPMEDPVVRRALGLA